MAKILSIFNNKGGVGKTTYMYHVAHLLARKNKKVLMVDCDSQCNLTSYTMENEDIEDAWKDGGNSIFKIIEPVYEGIGDFNRLSPFTVEENLYLVPGDLNLSLYEDRLGDTWNSAKGGSRPDLRIQTSIFRYIDWCISELEIDLVLVDLGPNLGALNRSVLGGSDYFITPIAADLFSLKGTNNLGNKLVIWAEEWQQIRNSNQENGILIPNGAPVFLGYVVQQHNVRNNTEGMTRGWQLFGNKISATIQNNIINRLLPINQVQVRDDYRLGQIPNLHSLIPYSLNSKKPVFDCTQRDGLNGAHITTAKESVNHFTDIVETIYNVI
ncbi:ParA family protein [Chryseobacterium binzhouense]|uniref:ParA family protein n=1 Tax=Chryseobacterium binzhouense TaxID=2593646 RepID=UPI00117CD52E|nr:AAA family ATPase [Chryseobacterium binzhouense]